MNGIYDFDNYRTPYLDTEMLMERKARKAKKRILMFATVAMILMIALFLRFAMEVSALGDTAVAIMCFVFFVYCTIGIILMEKAVKKKGEKICQ